MPPCRLHRTERGQLTAFNPADGTRLSFGPTPARLSAPELLDVKLTDVCSVGCEFCYQDSRPDRQHARVEDVAFIAAEAGQAGVFEVALGGGEVSEYPHFREALHLFRAAGVVPNFTTRRMRWLAREWPEVRELVGGVAVSVGSVAEIRLLNNLIPASERRPGQLVAQVVMGTVERAELLALMQEAGAAGIRVTLLGFKPIGRGETFKSLAYGWLDDLHEYVQHTPVSIDTALAAEYPAQLENLLLPGSYHTEEGRFSAYVDAVSMTLAPSSYHSGPSYPFNTHWLDAFATPDFVQGPVTPLALGRVRLGFATNSSSSHSVAILKKAVPEEIPESGRFGSWFVLVTPEAKKMYLAGMFVRHLLYEEGIDQDKLREIVAQKPNWWQDTFGIWWPQHLHDLPDLETWEGEFVHDRPLADLEDLKLRWERVFERVAALCDLSELVDVRGMEVDHQSRPNIPIAPDGTWPDPEVWRKVAKTILDDDYAVLGGWDTAENSLYQEKRAEFVDWTDRLGLTFDEFVALNLERSAGKD